MKTLKLTVTGPKGETVTFLGAANLSMVQWALHAISNGWTAEVSLFKEVA